MELNRSYSFKKLSEEDKAVAEAILSFLSNKNIKSAKNILYAVKEELENFSHFNYSE
jgi:hypothetical protein